MTKGCVMTLTKVISHKSKSQYTDTQNPCPGHNSSLPCWILIFHTVVVHDPRGYHDLDPRSYRQGQGHSAHIPKICEKRHDREYRFCFLSGLTSVNRKGRSMYDKRDDFNFHFTNFLFLNSNIQASSAS